MKKSLDKILVMTSQGIGNVIQQTPLNIALGSMYDVDVVYAHDKWDYSDIIKGMPNVNTVEKDSVDPDEYRLVINAAVGSIVFLREDIMKRLANKQWIWNNRPKTGTVNEVIENMSIAYSMGYKGEIPHLYCNKDNNFRWEKKDRQVIVIQCDSSYSKKTYPHFRELSILLSEKYDVILVGVNKSFDITGFNNIYDTRGKLTLLQYTSLISQADIVISSDSSAAHIAAAFDRKVAVIYGPTSIVKNKPFEKDDNVLIIRTNMECAPCWPSYKCKYEYPVCLYNIKPEEIIYRVEHKFGGVRNEIRTK